MATIPGIPTYSPDAVFVVPPAVGDAARGAALVAAYAAAVASGLATSTNRVAVVLPPGGYNLSYPIKTSTTSPGLTLSANYVDLVNQSSPGSAVIYSTSADNVAGSTFIGSTVVQSATDVRLLGIKFVGDIACRSFELAENRTCDNISSALLAATAWGHASGKYTYTLTLNASDTNNSAGTNIVIGDWIELYTTGNPNGTSTFPRRSYKVLSVGAAAGHRVIVLAPGLGGIQMRWVSGSGAPAPLTVPPYSAGPAATSGLTYIVRRPNTNSYYRDLFFSRDMPTSNTGNGGDVWGNGHISGTWIDCKQYTTNLPPQSELYAGNQNGGWRVNTWCHLMPVLMQFCEADHYSFGGDGTPSGFAGTQQHSYSWIGPGEWDHCRGATKCFGGCDSFGSPVLPDAIFTDTVAGYGSFAIGRRCSGTFVRCGGDNSCFGGTGQSLDGWQASGSTLVGLFDGIIKDSTVGYSSLGCGGNPFELVADSYTIAQAANAVGTCRGSVSNVRRNGSLGLIQTGDDSLTQLGLADTSANSIYYVTAKVVAQRTDAAGAAVFESRWKVETGADGTAVTITAVGTPIAVYTTGLSTAAISLVVPTDASGNGIPGEAVLCVAGEIGATINWQIVELISGGV